MNQYPTTQQLAVRETSSAPTQSPQMPISRSQRQAPPKLSKKDHLLAETRRVINEDFLHCTSATGAHYLVHKSSLFAFPAEAESIVGCIKRIAADSGGIDLSRGTISSAIEILRTETPANCTIGYGRSLRSPNGTLYIQIQQGAFQYSPMQKCFNRVERFPDIAFLQPQHAEPLPLNIWYNVDKQDVMRLFEQANLPRDRSLLIISWLILAWIPDTQKVLLELTGGRLSGKSSAQVLLKQLIDPSNENLTRDIPRTKAATQDLAQLNQVISLDQVDSLPDGVQKALLQLQQGDTIKWKQKRTREDTYVRVACPVILNSLDSVVTNSELSNSTLTIDLPALPDPTPRYKYPWGLPAIQAALLFILGDVHAALDYSSVAAENDHPSAMQHFCRVGCIVARSLGFEAQDFLKQLEDNRQNRHERALEDMPVALAIRNYVDSSSSDIIDVAVGNLLVELREHKPSWTTAKDWPDSPRRLGAMLRDIQPLLKTHGIQIEELGKVSGFCRVRLTKITAQPEPIKEPRNSL